ncbi:MAG TPA: RagB/SusD family nutrient uptake outer membrane protein [Ohtaekwangia sp.]|nr:RagB/SusD family nutrient uptake outer membrane protein [Ohtaekwangia sp.]
MMNIHKSKTFLAALLAGMMFSCIGDLDVEPIDENSITSATVFDSPEAYKQALAKLYAGFAISGQQGPSGLPDIAGVDEGFSCYSRSYWYLQELTTDEAVWTYDENQIFNLHYHTWTPSDVLINAMFSRITYVVVLANEYIRNTADATDPELQMYNREARFLRALAYYHGLDLFGDMPFVTEADEPGAFLPEQVSRAELFAYVESELKAIQNELGEPRFEYGRADKGSAAMLLAKLYLNAEVYLGEGNKKYTEAITELNKVIGASYSLAPKFLDNFVADNHNSPEIIFPINYDGDHTQAYAITQVMIFGNAGNGGWSGLRTTSGLSDKFIIPSDYRELFAKEDKEQTREITAINQSKQGYGVYKFRKENKDGSAGFTGDFPDTDFPLFRLADAYLMYAEAVNRGGTGGDLATAAGYINELRTRDDETPLPTITAADITGEEGLEFILDERARELYWEGHRRTDLIRFGKFTGGEYLWPWKGNALNGTSTPDHLNVFPIPSNDLGANPNLEQNTGY